MNGLEKADEGLNTLVDVDPGIHDLTSPLTLRPYRANQVRPVPYSRTPHSCSCHWQTSSGQLPLPGFLHSFWRLKQSHHGHPPSLWLRSSCSARFLVAVVGAPNRTIRRSGNAQPTWAMISADVTTATENDYWEVVSAVSSWRADYQLSNWRTCRAWRLLTMNSWPLVKVTSHRWLLSTLILRT
jgi:hypothetical protein